MCALWSFASCRNTPPLLVLVLGTEHADGEIREKTGGRSRALRHGAGDAQDGSHRGVRRRRSGVARVGVSLTGGGVK